MQKKLMIACMAVAAFAAFVIAPAASATTLTESGAALKVGSSITATNTGIFRFTGAFNLQCEKVHLQGSVTQDNTTGPVKGEIPVGSATISNSGSVECNSALGATVVTVTSKLCWETIIGMDTMKFTGCGANVKFDLKVGGVSCLYETASVTATFTTNSTPATVSLSEQPAKEVGGIFFCPDDGKLDMDLDLYTTGGTTGLTLS